MILGAWYGFFGHFSIKEGHLFVSKRLLIDNKFNVMKFEIRKNWRDL